MDPLYLDALATLETANGQKTIKGPKGEDSFNLYNIKDFSGNGFRAVDKAEGSNDAYRTYANHDESKADLISLLSRKYPKALEATSALQFASALKDGGYATDPNYVAKFVSVADQLGAQGDSDRTPIAVPAAAPDRSLAALYAAAQGPRPPKEAKLTATAKAAATLSSIMPLRDAPMTEDDWFKATGDSSKTLEQKANEARQTRLVDIARNLYMGTLTGELLKRLSRPEFTPDGFVPREPDLKGFSIEEQQHLRQATSKQEFERIKFDILEAKDSQQDAGKAGVGWAIAGAIVAGAPEAYVTGGAASLGLARLGLGSIKLAEAGRRAAAIGSLAAENVGVGLALTGAKDYMTPDVHLQDYIIGAIGDSLGMALHAPRVYQASRRAEHDALGKILDEAMGSRKVDIDEARATLGESATPEEVNARVREVQTSRVKSDIETHTADLPQDRKLIPDSVNDELFGEGAWVEKAAVADMALPQTRLERVTAGDTSLQEAARLKYDDPNFLQARIQHAATSPQWQKDISGITGGRTLSKVNELPTGVHVTSEAALDARLKPTIDALRELSEQYLPKSRVLISDRTNSAAANGEVISVGSTHLIGVKPRDGAPTFTLHAGVHELGHAVFHEHARFIPADLLGRIKDDYALFIAELKNGSEQSIQRRFAITSPNADKARLKLTPYTASVDEYMAEQFVKHIEQRALKDDSRLTPTLRQRLVSAVKAIMDFFTSAKSKGLLAADEGADEFFTRVLDGSLRQTRKMETQYLAPDLQIGAFDRPSSFSLDAAARTDADIMRDYGLDTPAGATTSQKAELKAMVHLYRKAEAYPMPDPARMSKLLSSAPMQWAAPTALTLLNSKNPVARMVAAELLESGSGAGGRRTTAAIAKWMHERQFMGNTLNEFQAHYTGWRNANGGGMREDYFGGEKWAEFNRRVATELEDRKAGRTSTQPVAVRDAADTLSVSYDRMRVTQQQLKTPGWAGLPADSNGYMPHRMSAGAVRAMTPDQGRVLHSVLKEQFENIEGFDEAFSGKLASKYIDVIRKRGVAGYSVPAGVTNTEAADIVEQSAMAMGMTQDEANALAKRVLKAAPAHTRSRLSLDLTRTYEADGKSFQLLDLFETDQLSLLRNQVSRVSGEAALVRHGIMGSTGMKLLRRAMEFGSAEGKADNAALEAFDQTAAELLGTPFGKQNGRWLDRALQFNSLASLGGMGFNQLAETLNGAVSLGARHAMASVGSLGRLRSEILALAKGKSVDNPIIGSLETYGAEFGTDHYKMVFPFDNPSRGQEVYGSETLTAGDRLLRSGLHLQGKLSLWRAISSAQERGMAEQIVHKALRYIRDGKESQALADMGIDSGTMDAIRKELPNVAKFDGRGRLQEFDITKLEDQNAANAFVQAVHRGTKQIIQGAFIGETGKWAHSGLLKLLTQFRTFSLIAIDKQWNRQVGNYGTAAALGILLGTMSFAAPIVMIRAGIQSVGRKDREEYLKQKLSPLNIARETLNYVALSGMAGDLLDATSAVAGLSATGGRTGSNKSLVGNVVAPAVGKANDIWGALQNNREGTDVHALVQQLPFARLPWLYPAVNSLKQER